MVGSTRTQILLLLGVAALLAIGLLLTADNLLRLGIMENAIDSPNELVRMGARIELAIARALALALAAGLLVLALVWPRLSASARYRAFMQRERPSLAAHRRFRRRLLTPSFEAMAAAIAVVFGYMAVGDDLLTPGQVLLVQQEDGIVESLSAVFLILAAAVSLRVALRIGRGRPEFYMHLFLGFLFFVMFGEEISWGQRYMGLTTPEFIAEVNVQGEINIHNLYGYFFDHMFILGFFLWGVAVPLLDRFAPVFRQLFAAIGLPVPSAGLAVAMLVITLMQSPIVFQFIEPFPPTFPELRVPEPREMLSALAFLVLMLEIRMVVAGNSSAKPRERAGRAAPDQRKSAQRQ